MKPHTKIMMPDIHLGTFPESFAESFAESNVYGNCPRKRFQERMTKLAENFDSMVRDVAKAVLVEGHDAGWTILLEISNHITLSGAKHKGFWAYMWAHVAVSFRSGLEAFKIGWNNG